MTPTLFMKAKHKTIGTKAAEGDALTATVVTTTTNGVLTLNADVGGMMERRQQQILLQRVLQRVILMFYCYNHNNLNELLGWMTNC